MKKSPKLQIKGHHQLPYDVSSLMVYSIDGFNAQLDALDLVFHRFLKFSTNFLFSFAWTGLNILQHCNIKEVYFAKFDYIF